MFFNIIYAVEYLLKEQVYMYDNILFSIKIAFNKIYEYFDIIRIKYDRFINENKKSLSKNH